MYVLAAEAGLRYETKIMKNTLNFALLALLSMALTGCVSSYPNPKARKVTQEREDMMLVKEDILRLKGQVEGLVMEMEHLRRELSRSQAQGSQAALSETSALKSRISELESRISSLQASREKDRKEIVNTLTDNMSKALANQRPASRPRSSAPSRPRSDYVLEHAVESGQTLSEIARVYGTSVQVIMDENGLKNANQIRVGQILYIPE